MGYASVGSPGLGYDVSYYNDKTDQQGVADVGTGPNCGSPVGLQWMLWTMGFYEGPIDGNIGPDTRAGLVAYGLSKGIFYDPQTTPSGAICQALIADYAAFMAEPPGATPTTAGQCPAGQWGTPPYCYGQPTEQPPERPAGAGTCPEGTMGLPPYCVAMPGYTAQPPAPTATTCPQGQVGVPPNCYGLPTGIPAVPGLPTTIPGLPGVPPVQPPPPGVPKPSLPPPTVPQTPPALPPGEKAEARGWWAERSDGEKLLLVVGGALVVVAGVAALSGGGKKRTASSYTPNRRTRGRKMRRNLRGARRKAAQRRARGGKVVKLKGGRRFGRGIPAKKYRKKGFVRKSQYAWPAGYMYPIGDYKHCKSAVSRFQKHKVRYPPRVRKVIAHNLLVCAPRVGMSLSPATQKSLLKDAKLKRSPKRLIK